LMKRQSSIVALVRRAGNCHSAAVLHQLRPW
jgi:hypothetical protein